MTISEYRRLVKLHITFDGWLPSSLPSYSEKCECGRRIVRRVRATVVCAKCGHEVKSYECIERERKKCFQEMAEEAKKGGKK